MGGKGRAGVVGCAVFVKGSAICICLWNCGLRYILRYGCNQMGEIEKCNENAICKRSSFQAVRQSLAIVRSYLVFRFKAILSLQFFKTKRIALIKIFPQKKDTTEVFFGLFVVVGFLLLITASKIEAIDSFEKFAENKKSIIISLILAIVSGIVTYYIRKWVFKLKQPNIKDPNELTVENVFAIAHGSSLGSIGLVMLALAPTSIDFLYILILGIFIIMVTLNTYFSSFWLKRIQGENSVLNIDALKLEHVEWSHYSNNVCIVFLLLTGIFLTYYSTSNTSSLLASNNGLFNILKNYINMILIIYVVFLTPIIWLLRPIHVTMNQIRKEIIKVKGDGINFKNNEYVESSIK